MNEDNDRREQIIEEATRHFLRYGYRKTTLDDIANQVGLRKTAFYYYFKNKEHLLLESIRWLGERFLSTLRAAVAAVEHPVERLEAFLIAAGKGLNDVFEEYQPTPNAMTDMPMSTKTVWKEVLAEEVLLVVDILEQGKATGEFQIAQPNLVATALVAGLHAFHAYSFDLQELHPKEVVRQELMSLLMFGLYRKNS